MNVTRPTCEDCGESYASDRFPDLVIDNASFAIIAPDDGLLCPNYICARLTKAGLSNVKGEFRSGPLARYDAVPEDWVVLPREPTYEMCIALGAPWESPPFPVRYRAMIAAASEADIQPFRPYVLENAEAGIAEMHLEDCATITGQPMTVHPLLRMSDRSIIGFQWDIPYGPLSDGGEDE